MVFANKPVTTTTKMNQITDHDTIETIIEDLDIHKEKEKAREIRNWLVLEDIEVSLDINYWLHQQLNIVEVGDSIELELMWEKLVSTLHEAIQKFIPTKIKINQTKNYWVTNRIKNLSNIKARLYKAYIENPTNNKREKFKRMQK